VKHALWFMLLICPFAFANCPTGQTKDEATLAQIEQSWAQALERKDSNAVGCILAEEFQTTWQASSAGSLDAIS
jgi:hypothetical protein